MIGFVYFLSSYILLDGGPARYLTLASGSLCVFTQGPLAREWTLYFLKGGGPRAKYR